MPYSTREILVLKRIHDHGFRRKKDRCHEPVRNLLPILKFLWRKTAVIDIKLHMRPRIFDQASERLFIHGADDKHVDRLISQSKKRAKKREVSHVSGFQDLSIELTLNEDL